jgi:hypothetical protein
MPAESRTYSSLAKASRLRARPAGRWQPSTGQGNGSRSLTTHGVPWGSCKGGRRTAPRRAACGGKNVKTVQDARVYGRATGDGLGLGRGRRRQKWSGRAGEEMGRFWRKMEEGRGSTPFEGCPHLRMVVSTRVPSRRSCTRGTSTSGAPPSTAGLPL